MHYLDDLPNLTVKNLVRSGALEPGVSAELHWITPQHEVRRLRAECVGRSLLIDGLRRPIRVALDQTVPNYGGKRDWLLCPKCEARRTKLFVQRDELLCRTCCGLPYRTQGEHGRGRAIMRAFRIRRKLGASLSLATPVLRKPRYMHWTTFFGLRASELAAFHEAYSR
jgi:hypothetical protein